MTYRLPSERVTLEVDDGPTVEVEKVSADLIYQTAVGLVSAVVKARPTAQARALVELYEFFVSEAQPTWEILDHLGPILPTSAGMLRLPSTLGLAICVEWAGTFIAKETAVDKMVPPSALRDELNERLRASRAA